MTNFTTILKIRSASPVWLVIIFIIGFTSISCADAPTDSLNKDSSKYLSFYETIDGERIHWEANFFGDEITSIYKNGTRIPDDLAADYKDKVYDQLDDMRFGGKKFTFRMPNLSGKEFHFDMEELHKDMEEMKKELPKLKENFQVPPV